MLICRNCQHFHRVQVSDRYCGECCIGETRNPIVINADITDCGVYEPKQSKKQTNGDRIRKMSDEELANFLETVCGCSVCSLDYESGQCLGYTSRKVCVENKLKWLQEEFKNKN